MIMLVHFINMKFNGDLREETFKILFLEKDTGFKYDTLIASSRSLLGTQCLNTSILICFGGIKL